MSILKPIGVKKLADYFRRETGYLPFFLLPALLLCAGPAAALEAQTATPGIRDLALPVTASSAPGWDGRLTLVSQSTPHPGKGYFSTEIDAMLFAPESVNPNLVQPLLANSSAGTPISTALFLPGVDLRIIPGSSPATVGAVGCAQDATVSIAIVPIGGFDANPYPSDSSGHPVAPGTCSGGTCYETYAFNVVTTQIYAPPGADCATNTSPRPANHPPLTPTEFYQYPGFVVVANPHTKSAQIAVAGPGAPGQAPLAKPEIASVTTLSGKHIQAIEPSISADGHFMVMNTNLNANGAMQSNGHLYFSYNSKAGSAAGWSEPMPLEQANALANNQVNLDGQSFRFGDVFPIANQPLRRMNGVPFLPVPGQATPQLPGAYPWISQDASDLIYVSNALPRGSMNVMGQHTGYATREMDNWINDSRDSHRAFGYSPGSIPGMWDITRGLSTPSLPIFPAKAPAVPVFSTNTGRYQELSLANEMDGHYAVYLEMNELVDYPPVPAGLPYNVNWTAYYTNRTPDTSGNFNTATLVGEAQFPYDYFGGNFFLCSATGLDPTMNLQPHCTGNQPNGMPYGNQVLRADGSAFNAYESQSISGQAVYLGASGAVVVPDNDQSLRFSQARGVSAEMWFRPLPGYAGTSLLNKGNAFGITMGGALRIRPFVLLEQPDGGEFLLQANIIPVTTGLTGWAHVAMTYNRFTGALITYLNGVAVDKVIAPSPLPVHDSVQPLVVGPGAVPDALPAPAAWNWAANGNILSNPQTPAPITPVLMVDEVKVSSVVRTPAEIATSALLHKAAATPRFTPPMPLGLSAHDLRMPASEQFQPATISFGQKLFYDPRLSVTGSVSCATCHSPGAYFTDPRGAVSNGVTGVALPRSAPSILNRAFGAGQMWDGAAGSLEGQAFLPLSHTNEMGNNTVTLSQLLNDIPEYQSAFQAATHQAPTPANVRPLVGYILANFERTLTSANSPADRYFADPLGNPLSASAAHGSQLFFGKARCVACHANSNYSDESFHRSILFGSTLDNPRDPGLRDFTGQASDFGKFKTPSLRNVAAVGHHFHNGSVATLAQVVALYNKGPSQVAGYPADPELRPLGLSDSEQADLVNFLASLVTSDSMPGTSPVKLPYPSATASPPIVVGSLQQNRICDLTALATVAPSPQSQVAYAYCLLHARVPDQSGLDSYAKGVALGTYTIQNFVDGAFASREFTQHYAPLTLSDADFATLTFQVFLFRDPTAAEKSAAVASLQGGLARAAFFGQVFQSAESRSKNQILF